MSHSDFDVVTGPSMPQQRPSPPSEPVAEPVRPNSTPIDAPDHREDLTIAKRSGADRGSGALATAARSA